MKLNNNREKRRRMMKKQRRKLRRKLIEIMKIYKRKKTGKTERKKAKK